jgi:hypothetical protein
MTYYEDFPDDSEWTRPLINQSPPGFMQRLFSVGQQEIGDLYRKKPVVRQLPQRKIDTNVDIPVSGLTGFKRRVR